MYCWRLLHRYLAAQQQQHRPEQCYYTANSSTNGMQATKKSLLALQHSAYHRAC